MDGLLSSPPFVSRPWRLDRLAWGLACALLACALPASSLTPAHAGAALGRRPAAAAGVNRAQGPGDAELSVMGQMGGDMAAIDTAGDLAYVGIGPRLVVVDVSDPALPRVRGQTPVLPGLVKGIDVEGTLVYAATLAGCG